MISILVDGWHTLFSNNGLNIELYALLEQYEAQKIIVTNATLEEQAKYGMDNAPYPLFSLHHNPKKNNPLYFHSLICK